MVFGLHAHRGKRSILLNLRSDQGCAALVRLIKQADVITMASLQGARDAALQLESAGASTSAGPPFGSFATTGWRWGDLVVPNAVRPRVGQITIPGRMPKYGQQTRAILSEIGYDAASTDAMPANGAAGDSRPVKFLPG